MSNMIDIKDVMSKTKLSRSMIYKLIRKGELPHFQFGNSIRFGNDEIEDWIKSQHKEANNK